LEAEARQFVGLSPAFKRRIRILINNLHIAATASRFMPLSSDSSTMDRLNVHGAIIDNSILRPRSAGEGAKGRASAGGLVTSGLAGGGA
jgi:hypothetical protein